MTSNTPNSALRVARQPFNARPRAFMAAVRNYSAKLRRAVPDGWFLVPIIAWSGLKLASLAIKSAGGCITWLEGKCQNLADMVYPWSDTFEPLAPAISLPPAALVPDPPLAPSPVLQPSLQDPVGLLGDALSIMNNASSRTTACLTPTHIIGAACSAGAVRTENQDACVAFELTAGHVAIVADGVGGTPLGRMASREAVRAAALSAMRAMSLAPTLPTASAADPQSIAEAAMLDASLALAQAGLRQNISAPEQGLRTTLIITIIIAGKLGYAYLGDGMGQVVSLDGHTRSFLQPQRGEACNILAGSLGPQIMGTPAAGALSLNKGDMLVITTDGVCDRLNDGFAAQMLAQARRDRRDGDLQSLAQAMVEDVVGFKLPDGSCLADDNLTLVLMRPI